MGYCQQHCRPLTRLQHHPVPCRLLPERGEYRLQSEDGSVTVPESGATGIAEAYSNAAGDPAGSVLSLGRAAVHSMQPEATETDELTQLITPLVLGKLCCLHNPTLYCKAAGLAVVVPAQVALHQPRLMNQGSLGSNRYG